jgi:ATP phosphoribosyltransferase
MNDKEIVVHIKNVYGTDKVYPACKKAHLFTDIAGTTTLRVSDLKTIEKLGYSIRIEHPTFEELTNVS